MSVLGRLSSAWRGLEGAQRRVVAAAIAVLGTMFLPWYSRDGFATTPGATPKTKGQLLSAHDSTMAIGVFSFVEAAIFLVAVGVMALMFARGERRAFHLPGGDGTIVTIAGGWTAFLIFYRFVDQPSGSASSTIAYDYGLHWGIFFGLLAALFLAYSGNHLRTASLVEPPIPGQTSPSTPPPAVAEQITVAERRRRRGVPLAPIEQLSFEEAPAPDLGPDPDDLPTRLAPQPPPRRADPFERPATFDDEPPEFPPRARPSR